MKLANRGAWTENAGESAMNSALRTRLIKCQDVNSHELNKTFSLFIDPTLKRSSLHSIVINGLSARLIEQSKFRVSCDSSSFHLLLFREAFLSTVM